MRSVVQQVDMQKRSFAMARSTELALHFGQVQLAAVVVVTLGNWLGLVRSTSSLFSFLEMVVAVAVAVAYVVGLPAADQHTAGANPH